MDQTRFANAVFDANPKRLADFGREAKGPVWLPDGVDRRRLAVHLDVAPLEAQDRQRRRGAVGKAGLTAKAKVQRQRALPDDPDPGWALKLVDAVAEGMAGPVYRAGSTPAAAPVPWRPAAR